MWLNLFLITLVIVFVQNHSGFTYNLGKFIYEKANKGVYLGQPMRKLFSCSLCQVHWITLFYCLFTGIGVIHSFGIATVMAILSLLVDKLLMLIIRTINRIG